MQVELIRADSHAYSYIKGAATDMLVLQPLMQHDEGKLAHLH